MTRITVRVTPRAARNEVTGWEGDALRVRVTAPPADGKANYAVIGVLSRALGVPRSKVRIISGVAARTKVIDIDGISLVHLRTALKALA